MKYSPLFRHLLSLKSVSVVDFLNGRGALCARENSPKLHSQAYQSPESRMTRLQTVTRRVLVWIPGLCRLMLLLGPWAAHVTPSCGGTARWVTPKLDLTCICAPRRTKWSRWKGNSPKDVNKVSFFCENFHILAGGVSQTPLFQYMGYRLHAIINTQVIV